MTRVQLGKVHKRRQDKDISRLSVFPADGAAAQRCGISAQLTWSRRISLVPSARRDLRHRKPEAAEVEADRVDAESMTNLGQRWRVATYSGPEHVRIGPCSGDITIAALDEAHAAQRQFDREPQAQKKPFPNSNGERLEKSGRQDLNRAAILTQSLTALAIATFAKATALHRRCVQHAAVVTSRQRLTRIYESCWTAGNGCR